MDNHVEPLEHPTPETGPQRGMRGKRGAKTGEAMTETVVRLPAGVLAIYQFLGRFTDGGQNKLLSWAIAKATRDLLAFQSKVAAALGGPAPDEKKVPVVPDLESLFTVGRDVWVVGPNGPERTVLWFKDGKVIVGD